MFKESTISVNNNANPGYKREPAWLISGTIAGI